MLPDGSFVYSPNSGFVGNDLFVFSTSDGGTHSAWFVVFNAAVQAVDDQVNAFQGTDFDSASLNLPSLFANDTDADGDAIQLVSYTQPAHGWVTVLADGSYIYETATGFQGADAFNYTITDGAAISTGHVTVNITDHAPVAENDFFTLHAGPDAQLFGDVLQNDTDADGNELAAVLVTEILRGEILRGQACLYEGE